jgi:hypothetical protein
MDAVVADNQTDECLAEPPASSATYGGRVKRGRVAFVETIDRPVRQQHPCGAQVANWVSGTHVAKVYHAAEIAVVRQDVGWVKVRKEPHGRTCPSGSGHCIIPGLTNFVRIGYQPTINCLLQKMRNAFVGSGQWSASAVPAGGCIARRAARKAARIIATSAPSVAGARSADTDRQPNSWNYGFVETQTKTALERRVLGSH